MINTPQQPYKRYGLGAVNYHTGETLVLVRQHKRRREVAQLLQALLDKHPTKIIYVAWDNCTTHQDDEVEAVVRGAAGRLVLLYLTNGASGGGHGDGLNYRYLDYRRANHDHRGDYHLDFLVCR